MDRDLGNTAEDIHWIPGFKVSNIDTWIWDYTVDSDGVYSLSYVAHKNEVKDINKDEYQSTLKGVEINNGEAYIKGVNKDSDFIIDKDTIFVDTPMNHKPTPATMRFPTWRTPRSLMWSMMAWLRSCTS